MDPSPRETRWSLAWGLVVTLALACAAQEGHEPEPEEEPKADGAAGVRFEPMASPTAIDLTAAWVSPDDSVWVAGTGLTMRRDAGGWQDRSEGLTGEIADLWVADDGRRVAGSIGALLVADADGPWRVLFDMPSFCFRLTHLHLLEGRIVHAVCPYYDGLIRIPLDGGTPAELFSDADSSINNLVWSSSAADVTAIHWFEVKVVRYRGGPWTETASWPTEEVPAAETAHELAGLWGPEGDTLVAVGKGGVILRRAAGVWEREASGVETDLTSVWGTPEDGLFAVGMGGVALFNDGQGWRPLETGTTADLLAVRGNPGGEVVAVGAHGTLLHLVR